MRQEREQRWSVGEVVAYLKRWFPDVRASQLRFWEKEGLIEAYRTEGGHRQYCPEKVERLRKILLLRRWFRLSLPETKAMLPFMDKPGGWLLLLEKGTMGIAEPLENGERLERGQRVLEKLDIHPTCPVTGELVEEVRHLAPVMDLLFEDSELTPEDFRPLFRKIQELVDLESELARRSGMPLERFWELLRRVRTWVHLYFVRKKFFEEQTQPLS